MSSTTALQTRGESAVDPFRDGAVTVGFAAAALGALALMFWQPMSVSVLGLAALGLAHVMLELRYIIGRFSSTLTGHYAVLMALLLTLVVLGRALTNYAPGLGRGVEIVIGFLILATGARLALRGQARNLAYVVIGLAAGMSLHWPQWYMLFITHIHNLVPVVFLWEWSRRLRSKPWRWAFRGLHLTWASIIPALILSGAFDRFIGRGVGVVADVVGDGMAVVNAAAPPGAELEPAWRFMVAFAFLQTMHYVVWIGFFPLFGRDATRAFERRFPRLNGRVFWPVLIVASVFIFTTFTSNYGVGRSLYSLVAAYHVYLEFPLLLLVLARAVQTNR